MFGTVPSLGITTSALPSDVLRNIEDEEEFQRVTEDMNAQQNAAEICGEEENKATSSMIDISSARKAAQEAGQESETSPMPVSYTHLIKHKK